MSKAVVAPPAPLPNQMFLCSSGAGIGLRCALSLNVPPPAGSRPFQVVRAGHDTIAMRRPPWAWKKSR